MEVVMVAMFERAIVVEVKVADMMVVGAMVAVMGMGATVAVGMVGKSVAGGRVEAAVEEAATAEVKVVSVRGEVREKAKKVVLETAEEVKAGRRKRQREWRDGGGAPGDGGKGGGGDGVGEE